MYRIAMMTGILILAACSAFAEAKPGDAILGQWYTDGNDSIVIVSNGKDKKLSGKIIWLREPLYEKGDEEAGKPKHDRKNPDKGKRKNRILGLAVLNGFKYDSKDKAWNAGKIYDPNNGRTYKCVIRMLEDKTEDDMQKLKVRGYIGIPALGRTTVWTRVPEDKLIKQEKDKTPKAAE